MPEMEGAREGFHCGLSRSWPSRTLTDLRDMCQVLGNMQLQKIKHSIEKCRRKVGQEQATLAQ